MPALASLFAPWEILVYGLVAGALAAAVTATRGEGRRNGHFAVVGATTLLGWLAWNFTLNATDADGFNVDAPVVAISWADAGSGVLAFAVTALVLGLVTERAQRASRVVGTAVIAGVAAILVDLVVL
jgi:hypothetical protein